MTPARPLNEFYTSERAVALMPSVDLASVPRHIAIIMDGNGRWAKSRSLPRIAGHRAGAVALRDTIGAAIELGVRFLTVYSFSSENWSRPEDEVSGLMSLFVEVLERELASLQERDVRVIVVGRMGQLPRKTREAFDRCMIATAQNDGMTLLVALNYGARAEIVDAARALLADVAAGIITPEQVDEGAISARLYSAGIPDPDLVIRTSGEMRVSNFLLWQIAYSEFWVTETLWPDFDRDDLLQAVSEYQNRERRFGGAA